MQGAAPRASESLAQTGGLAPLLAQDVSTPGHDGVLVGLIGAGIQGSLSPRMHEREGAHLGLRYRYKLIDIDALGLGTESLDELLRAAEGLGFAGLNVTYPCKQAVIPLLDRLSP